MYDWAVNEKKLERAIQTLKSEGKEVTEAAIKALYIQYGGLVHESAAEEDLTLPKEEVEEEEKPKRRKK